MIYLALAIAVFASFMTWVEYHDPDGLSFETQAMWVLAAITGGIALGMWVV